MEKDHMEMFGMLKKCHCRIFEGKPGTMQDRMVKKKWTPGDVSKVQQT
jgi:hypothetical protein